MSNPKQLAGERAASYVEDGMKVGLGTGSTAYFAVKKLGERVRNGLKMTGIPTSKQTESLARQEGIPLAEFGDVQQLDITIDGADEFDPQLQLIKGGGGALLREKMVASISDRLIIIADERKQVDWLGSFPLPLEVVSFGWEITFGRVEQMGLKPGLRKKDGQAFLTDNGNYILDCQAGKIEDPAALHTALKSMLGIVETGLFIDMTSEVIMGKSNGEVEIFTH